MAMQFDPSIFGGLRTFEVAARVLSFTKAAEILNITQSAVSQQIRHLEQRLGYPLFIRHHGRLSLTQHGQVLFDASARAFQDIERALTRLGTEGSVLQVSCLPSFALEWLGPRLPDFHQANPGLVVRLKAEFPHALNRQAIRESGVDAAIRLDPRDKEENDAEPILDEYLLPVATPEYLAQHPEFASGQSMRGITLLHDGMPWEGAPEFIEWRTWLALNRPDWLPGLEGIQFNLGSLAIRAALNHQGVAMARTALVGGEIRSGRLVNVFNSHVLSPAHYVVLTEHHDNPDLYRFKQWLQQECQRFDQSRTLWLPEKA